MAIERNQPGQFAYSFAYNHSTGVPLVGQAANLVGDMWIDGVSNPVPGAPLDMGTGHYQHSLTQGQTAGRQLFWKPRFLAPPADSTVLPVKDIDVSPFNASLLDISIGGQGSGWMNVGKVQDSELAAASHRGLLGGAPRFIISDSGPDFIETTDATIITKPDSSFINGPDRVLVFHQGTTTLFETRVIENYTLLTAPARGRFEFTNHPLLSASNPIADDFLNGQSVTIA